MPGLEHRHSGCDLERRFDEAVRVGHEQRARIPLAHL